MDIDTQSTVPLEIQRRLERLIEANQSLATVDSLEHLIPKLIKLARVVTDAEAASFLMYKRDENLLEFATVHDEVIGDPAEKILKNNVQLKMGEGIAGWVAQSLQPLNIQDAHRDSRFSHKADNSTGFMTRALLCVPVVHDTELLGVIEVLNPKEKSCFDEADQQILSCFSNLAAVAIIRAQLLAERIQQEKLAVQLETAANIQSLFWPTVPDVGRGSHIWGISLPASMVGGDLYDWIPLPDGQWLVYAADVSDKGLPAAMIMVALWSQIRAHAFTHHHVSDILHAVNTTMHTLLCEEGFFATILLARYDPKDSTVRLTTGGHVPPVWISDRRIMEVPALKGMSLGLIPDARFQEIEISLAPNDALLLITDGVTEACNQRNELFGIQGVQALLREHHGPPWGTGLVNAVKGWHCGGSANDDLTVVEIWRDPV